MINTTANSMMTKKISQTVKVIMSDEKKWTV